MANDEAVHAHVHPTMIRQVPAQLGMLLKLVLPAFMQIEVRSISNFDKMDHDSGVTAIMGGKSCKFTTCFLNDENDHR